MALSTVPRAQKCCPTKLRRRSLKFRTIWIALFPFLTGKHGEVTRFGGTLLPGIGLLFLITREGTVRRNGLESVRCGL